MPNNLNRHDRTPGVERDVEQHNPPPKDGAKPKMPKWSSPFWYLPVMVLLLWFWQNTVSQFSYRTIPYSEFKNYLARHEVIRCIVRDDEIQGEILPKTSNTAPSATASPTNSAASTQTPPKPILFRTVRIEDPKLVDELQGSGVQFRGE